MSEQFDPAEHTVVEVEEYLAAHPDERDAVLAAEAEGKARTTLVGSLPDESEEDGPEVDPSAVTTKTKDYAGRALLDIATAAKDYMGRATTTTADYAGRALVD